MQLPTQGRPRPNSRRRRLDHLRHVALAVRLQRYILYGSPAEYHDCDCRFGWAYIPREEYAGKLDFEGGYNDGADGGYLSSNTTKIYAPGTPMIMMVMVMVMQRCAAVTNAW